MEGGVNGASEGAVNKAERAGVLTANAWADGIAASSALEASMFGPSGDASTSGVRVTLPGVVGLLVVRADPESTALADAFSEVLDLPLPERLGSTASGACCARWISPDEWLLSCPPAECAEVERGLRNALDGAFSVTEVTGGYALLELSGPEARTVLAKSTPLDVDPRAFSPGRVAGTVFAKTTVTLRHVDDGRYELICRRSFADYVARWIARASDEHGLSVTEARG